MPDVAPLTPTPGGQNVNLPWPEVTGPYLLTVHLARVDGRTIVTGLDIGQTDPDDPKPVNHPALRSLNAGRIAEAARARLAALLAAEGTPEAASVLTELIAPDVGAPSGPRPAPDHLVHVAELWNRALAMGGEATRSPSVYVHRWLRDEGQDVTLAAVRGQIHRARVRGLIRRDQQ